MAEVPASDRFLTLDELNADLERLARDHPEVASTRRVGSSKLGEPIRMLSVGRGARHALPPRGALGYPWPLIPCVDPDGPRPNEGWFAGPFAPRHCARHFYRPSS